MKIGMHVVNARPWATAESIVSLGTRAEALWAGVATLRELLDRNGRQTSDVTISAKFRLYNPGTGPVDQPHESELTGRAELIAEKIRSYQDAGLQYLILDPTQHSASGEPLEAIGFFAYEVKPLLG